MNARNEILYNVEIDDPRSASNPPPTITTENLIRDELGWYNGLSAGRKSNVAKLFTTDEAIYPELYNLQRVNWIIGDELGGAAPGWSFCRACCRNGVRVRSMHPRAFPKSSCTRTRTHRREKAC